MVQTLDTLFSELDEIVVRAGATKIKTIGDGYFFAVGVLESMPEHAIIAVSVALDFLEALARLNAHRRTSFKMRLGVASGDCIAGVVGSVRIAYDLWGSTVNLASRCESYCVPNECTIASSTAGLICNDSRFIVTPVDGTMMLKGIGEVQLHTVRKSE